MEGEIRESVAADLGGSVLTGTLGNPLGIVAHQLGYVLHKVRDKCLPYSFDGKPVDPDMDMKVEAAFNHLLDKASSRRQLMGCFSVDASLGVYEPQGITVPEPIQTICTRWGSDPFSLGAYSTVAVGASGDDYDILAETVGDGRLFFAGEATNRRSPATMHDAFLSGLREAANMAH
ncbi:hypothetical protein C1H46_043614 [Malus baccata]|uniref:Amine oxidase domain-containing protein n=1 Tax=Malus baccata TaxID=106549 RepID=A0A540K9D2_MALBA|nr:hypothetical protein C1H46_043614 [Malus baccata]